MKYLVLLYRDEDALENEAYWTDDYADAVEMAENPEYHSAMLIDVRESTPYRM